MTRNLGILHPKHSFVSVKCTAAAAIHHGQSVLYCSKSNIITVVVDVIERQNLCCGVPVLRSDYDCC